MASFRLKFWVLTALAAAALAGCTASSGSGTPIVNRFARLPDRSGSVSPIEHVVLIVQENRTFNDFFATYPGSDGTTTGTIAQNSSCNISKTQPIALTKSPLITSRDLSHNFGSYNTARDGGKMDKFDYIHSSDGTPECAYPYQYTDPSQIQPYWSMAQQYVLAEHMFTTQGSSSFTGHQDLIKSGTMVTSSTAIVDLPSCSGGKCIWGCDAPPGTHTNLISKDNKIQFGKGPFPCTKQFSVSYTTLRDLLDAKSVSWRYYAPPICCSVNGKLFTAFDVIAAVRYGSEWKTNMSSPETNIFNDIYNGTLASVSWLIPSEANSDHPGEKSDTGPSWVASVVNAIGESPYWNSTAIIVVWDDWGGLYDNLNPSQVGYGGLGFRVPALIISPYAKAGYISQTNYEFGSILKYIEGNWKLGSLGGRDKLARSLIDCFNYSQQPIKFREISSKYPLVYFMNEKPSYRAPDTDM